MATKLYLITSTVATGVGGGFFCSQLFLRGLTLPIAAPLSSKMAKLFLWLPSRRCYHPAAIFQQSRAKVGPNSYARGDCTRPCYARQRSLKREPAYRKTKHIPERVFPTRAGDAAYGAKTKPVFPAHGGIPRCRTPLETPRPPKIFPMRKEHHNVQLTENSLKILQSSAKWHIL
jgi:hypothetical protein